MRTQVVPISNDLEKDEVQWAQVQEELRAAHWTEGSVVSLTRWLPNLTDVVVPAPWRSEDGRLRPLRDAGGELANLSLAELVDLVQWTDLILFDYLTANFDRLVSNLFSLQWDPRVMQRATSNLHRGPGGALVFLDNEAGLVHGYRVAGMWDKYNEPLLQSVCVFRERTARLLGGRTHRGEKCNIPSTQLIKGFFPVPARRLDPKKLATGVWPPSGRPCGRSLVAPEQGCDIGWWSPLPVFSLCSSAAMVRSLFQAGGRLPIGQREQDLQTLGSPADLDNLPDSFVTSCHFGLKATNSGPAKETFSISGDYFTIRFAALVNGGCSKNRTSIQQPAFLPNILMEENNEQ
ncbi:PREDICTED: four-jointed box protein 1 [Colobus angolensis palliatus]|uniref:four-jointed box protein 1 n=1 Tax=Colobus angolensis palliatus TaxID=336983 RepID=UPI0005F36767|nr:PREDICTED: four-jointed box protein 1 [Colobus angolensis palliatus]